MSPYTTSAFEQAAIAIFFTEPYLQTGYSSKSNQLIGTALCFCTKIGRGQRMSSIPRMLPPIRRKKKKLHGRLNKEGEGGEPGQGQGQEEAGRVTDTHLI
jgi:hypothetical protein